MGLFHTASSVLVLNICEKLPTCHYSVDDMVLKIFCQFLVAAIPGPFFNSAPLSDKMYLGHMCTGRYSFMNVVSIVSADLSGIGYASGHPVR